MQRAFKAIREHGGVCISDEVQTGFGRTGEHFWGFEAHGVIPDIGETDQKQMCHFLTNSYGLRIIVKFKCGFNQDFIHD